MPLCDGKPKPDPDADASLAVTGNYHSLSRWGPVPWLGHAKRGALRTRAPPRMVERRIYLTALPHPTPL